MGVGLIFMFALELPKALRLAQIDRLRTAGIVRKSVSVGKTERAARKRDGEMERGRGRG